MDSGLSDLLVDEELEDGNIELELDVGIDDDIEVMENDDGVISSCRRRG